MTFGPVQCAWRPHAHGTRAEPLVRDWLAGLLDASADALPLTRDVRGRPVLGTPLLGTDVNWSHSGEGLLMAHGAGVRLGVDLERLRPRPRALELARRYFAPAEAAHLASLGGDARAEAFLRLWCAKEAVLKAHGHGLSFGLDRVAFAPTGAGWQLVQCDPVLGAPGEWTVQAFSPATGYLAALAWRRV